MKHDTLPHVMIAVNKIKPHPDNPRKDLGDLEELVESIRKNGIMQNLTIIPEDEENEDNDNCIALIGHRRLAAAKEAHIYDVPCNIVYGLSHREQIGIMLEENMQRSDLTPIEQAYGFQMMLDLGETEESIAEKTGFSRTTVHHRLEIAKLDRRIMKETEEFQYSIGDLMALEQVKSIARRNAILNNAKNSAELRSRAAIEAAAEKREERKERLIPMLKAIGIKPLPEKLQSKIWTSDLKRVKGFSLNEEIPEDTGLKEKAEKDQLYWYEAYNEIDIYKKETRKKEEQQIDQKIKKQKEDRGAMTEIVKRMIAERQEHVKAMLNGSAKSIKSTPENWEKLYDTVFRVRAFISHSYDVIVRLFTGKQEYQLSEEEKQEWKEKVAKMGSIERMLACVEEGMQTIFPFQGYGPLKFSEEYAAQIREWNDFLGKFGFKVTDPDAIKALDGTHELYEKEEK